MASQSSKPLTKGNSYTFLNWKNMKPIEVSVIGTHSFPLNKQKNYFLVLIPPTNYHQNVESFVSHNPSLPLLAFKFRVNLRFLELVGNAFKFIPRISILQNQPLRNLLVKLFTWSGSNVLPNTRFFLETDSIYHLSILIKTNLVYNFAQY